MVQCTMLMQRRFQTELFVTNLEFCSEIHHSGAVGISFFLLALTTVNTFLSVGTRTVSHQGRRTPRVLLCSY